MAYSWRTTSGEAMASVDARLSVADRLRGPQRARHDASDDVVEESVTTAHRRVEAVEPEVRDQRRIGLRERVQVQVEVREEQARPHGDVRSRMRCTTAS